MGTLRRDDLLGAAVLLTVGVLLLVLVPEGRVTRAGPDGGAGWADVVALVVACAGRLERRARPLLGLAAGVAGAVLGVLLAGAVALGVLIVLADLLYGAVRYGTRGVSRAVSVGAAVLLALAALAGLVTGGPGAAVRTLLNLSLVLGLPVLWAREVRQQRELADAEHARAEQDALLDGARARGQRVELDDRRGGARLTAAADLAAHRVVQEALTNAAKHAPGRAVRVVLRRGGVGVVVEVGTDLVPGAGPGDGTGSGLVGLAERARAAGGRLAAGAEGGRWTVRAELPTAGAAADAADPAVEGAP